MALHRMRQRGARAALARVPERPSALLVIRPQVEMARHAGVTVDEPDGHHLLLTYDARDRDQWLAVDGLYDAAYPRSTIEADGAFDSAPGNWMIIHFDYGACGMTRPDVPERAAFREGDTSRD